MKLRIMLFSPTSRHFIPIRFKFSPQHPETKFHTHKVDETKRRRKKEGPEEESQEKF
jgi:hypothetical protein